MAEYTYALIRYRWTSEQTTAEPVGGAFLSNQEAKQAMLADLRSTLPNHAQREEFDFGFVSDDGMLVINTQNASYWSEEEEIAWQITYYKPLPHLMPDAKPPEEPAKESASESVPRFRPGDLISDPSAEHTAIVLRGQNNSGYYRILWLDGDECALHDLKHFHLLLHLGCD